jgi:hypothetical protein
MIRTCGRCDQPATYDPARGGTITAQPCGHVITYAEARSIWPREFAEIEAEINMTLVTICPECWAGKHANCHGDAWDNENDRPAICACWTENHTYVLRERSNHGRQGDDLQG